MNFWTANVSVHKEVCEKVGDFDIAYRHYGVEDTEWGYRAEKIGCRVVYHPEAKATHEHDMSSLERFCERQRKVASNFVLFFRTHPEALSSPGGPACICTITQYLVPASMDVSPL